MFEDNKACDLIAAGAQIALLYVRQWWASIN